MIVCLSLDWFENQSSLEHYIAYVVQPALPMAGERIELDDGSMY